MMKIEKNELPSSIGIVIFGASGDLTQRKLIPSLYQLFRNKKLPPKFYIVGASRTNFNDDTFREHFSKSIQDHLEEDEYDIESANSFFEHLHYHSMNLNEDAGYESLKKRLNELDEKFSNLSNYIFYLSTPPSLYGDIPRHLKNVGLNNKGKNEGDKGIRRIVIEKPFGFDLETAQQLNAIYDDAFSEEQLFRIDHFLGKETVQNIMAFRFSNGIFEPLWNRRYIDRIEVTAIENFGIGKRGGFFDQTGTLRDMVQNHLIQLLALVAMEPPAVFNAKTFRDEVLKVYQSLKPLTKEDIKNKVIRGQYLESSKGNGQKRPAYRDEEKVADNSRTETFLAMQVAIENWRWSGVPFYIRTGKQMPTKVTEIVVHFKKTPHSVFGEAPANTLILRIQPNEGVVLKFDMKMPGSKFDVKQVSMDFSYDKLGGVPSGDAYSRLLEDCIRGDQTLFTRSDAVEASWVYFTPILNAWQEDDKEFPLYGYPAGTWGPKGADDIIDGDYNWTNPCKNLTNTDLYCEL